MVYSWVELIHVKIVITMSQKGSSIVSSDNPEVKYKKALMEIQKIHNANKVLKAQSEELKAEYERQIQQLAESHHRLEDENAIIKNDKADLQKFLEELQVSNTELRKEYNSLEREVTYLNDVLAEQNTQLKKMNAYKDEKGLSALIASYEDRQISYRKDISRQEELLRSLRASCESLQSDLAEQRRQRFMADDLNNALRIELAKYRELNSTLLAKNEAVVAGMMARSAQGKDKYREAEAVLGELGKQLQLVRASRAEQQALQRTTVALDSYETLLQEKGKVEAEVQRLRNRLQESQSRAQEVFSAEERMKQATLKAERLQEECNMLKSKLVVVETKDLMESAEDGELKEFQERVMANLGQNDPLPAIKNSADSSHFQLMKGYLVELKQKLGRALQDRKDYEKKYRSLKDKVCEKAQKAMALEEQNKLLRGKLEGFERLSERLQFQLQRNIDQHDEEVAQMKNLTSSVLAKKAEETKAANAIMRAQLDLQLDKFDRAERSLRQQVETLKLQISTERIKNGDLAEKLSQTTEFLNIFQAKHGQATQELAEAHEAATTATANAEHFEELYRQERAKNEALLAQKQALTSQLSQLNEHESKRVLLQADAQAKEEAHALQIRRLKTEAGQARTEISQLQAQLNTVLRQSEDRARLAVHAAPQDNTYYSSLQANYQQQREKNRQLQSQLATLKLRAQRAALHSQKTTSLEDALTAKANELNDVRRKTIAFEKQVGVLEAEMKQIRNEYDGLKRENATLKARLLQNGQDIRRGYQGKEVDAKRQLQKLTEQLAAATSELREEKRSGARWQTDLQNIKTELRRCEELLEQSKRKEAALTEELSQLRSAYQVACDDNERLKSEVKYKTAMQEGLNAEINGTQDRIFKLTQENTENRLKLQSLDNNYSDLRREIGGLKIYLNEIEEFANGRGSAGSAWQEQRDKENLANFVQRLKKVMRSSELAQGTSVGNTNDFRGNFTTASFTPLYGTTPLPDYLKPYEPIANAPKYNPSEESSPFTLNYDAEGTYKY